MKLRYSIIILLLFFSLRVTAQPPETIYLGTVAQNGYIDDQVYGPYNIGFTFNFYGNDYTQFYINSNGQVLFGAGSLESAAVDIPNTSLPNNFIAPFWDDLVVDSYGKILYTTFGAASNKKLVIQFTNMGFYPFPATMGTFSVILYETSNVIQVQYRLIVLSYSGKAHGGSATIGLENATGTAGAKYAFHNPSAVNSEQAISFTPIAGPAYTINSNALYDGIYLTTNLSLPAPSIPNLITPPSDAIMGTDVVFEWASALNAASYTLYVGTDPELISASSYPMGTNLSHSLTGLTLDATYYWGVFAQNTTGTTWCEIKRFTTATLPPLTPVPQTIWVEKPLDKTIKLQYTGGDGSPKTAIVTTLPGHGELYQYNAGVRGSQITSVPADVTDAGMNIIYASTGNTGTGVGNFNFKVHDSSGDSPERTITVNVSPAGIPHVLYFAKNTNTEIQFDIPMADPTGKHGQFTVKNNGTPLVITSASLKAGDPYTIVLTTSTPPSGTVLISYTQGDVSGLAGGLLLPFTDLPVTLTAQTITFSQSLAKKYSDSPFELSASASSGLGLTWASSNLAVATIVSNIATFLTLGTSDITSFQAGNATYAPAKYIKTLTVARGDQIITFSDLPVKTSGDADFTISAVAGSSLPVTFASDNTSIATVTGNSVHIVSAGTAVITASQSGNSLWNAAPDLPRTLTINKALATITPGSLTTTYNSLPQPATATTVPAGLNVTFTYDGSSTIPVNAGSYAVVATINDSNYQGTNTGTLIIGKAALTATADSKTKIYGEVNPPLTVSYSGLLGTDAPGDLDTPPVAMTTALQSSDAGVYPITISGGTDNNYTFLYTNGVLTVNRASIYFTADNKTRAYLAQNPVLTYTSSGYVMGETQSVLDVLPVIQTSAVQSSPVAVYPITLSGGSDNNYNYTYTPGTLTITKIPQTITFSSSPETLAIGYNYTLAATSTSGLTVLYESVNNNIASVAGNVVTGISEGTVQIRAYHPGDQNYNASELFVSIEVYRNTHKDIMHLFTPNNDGFNDYWELPDLVEWGKCDVRVFTRSGKLVYANKNYNNDWDGTSNGNLVPEGAYYFVIKTENAGDVKGTVNIVR